MFNAMTRVVPSHLADRSLYPFTTLQPSGVPDPTGDKAFDDDEDESCGSGNEAVVRLMPRDDD